MENYEVPGAHDPALSSRAKDELFADEPREQDAGEKALAEHRAAVKQTGDADTEDLTESVARARAAEPAEGMLAETPPQPAPERHESGGPYEEEARDASVDDADFDAEETNRKDGTA